MAIRTFYISYSSGNDTNTGLSESLAIKTLSKLQEKLNVAQPGDEYLFKRGDTWTTRCGVSVNYGGAVGLDLSVVKGTSTNYIKIGAYGTGNDPIFNFSGTGTSFWFDGAQYLNIENIKLTTTAAVNNRPHEGFYTLITETKYVNIKNCEINNLLGGFTIQGSAHDITIDNCNVHDNYSILPEDWISLGIFVKCNNITLKNSTFTNNGKTTVNDDGIHDHEIYIEASDNFICEYNTFHHENRGNIAKMNGTNLRFSNNTLYGSTYDAISFGSYPNPYDDNPDLDGLIIENNKIYDCSGGIFCTKQSTGTAGNVSNVVIKNNLLVGNSGASYGAILIEESKNITNLSIYNNTIYNFNSDCLIFQSSPIYSNINVKNNIFVNTQYSGKNLLMLYTNPSNINLDYNLYYTTVGNEVKVSSTNMTLATFKSTYSKETNGITGNPLFVTTGTDFHLQSNSPAKNAGTNVGVTIDIEGIIRPQETNYDIGAYEYSSGITEQPITIITQPIDKTTYISENVSFTCEFTGPNNKGYQWWINDSIAATDGTDYSGSQTNTITVLNPQLSDSGLTLTCECKNLTTYPVDGSWLNSNTVTLTVIENQQQQIVITLQPTNKTINESQTASFSCEFTGPTNKGYQWWYNGSNMAIDGNKFLGSQTSNLTVKNTQITDNNMQLKCECKNLATYPIEGSWLDSNTVILTVNAVTSSVPNRIQNNLLLLFDFKEGTGLIINDLMDVNNQNLNNLNISGSVINLG